MEDVKNLKKNFVFLVRLPEIKANLEYVSLSGKIIKEMDFKQIVRECVDSIYLSANNESRRNNLNIALKSSSLYSPAKVASWKKFLFMELIRCVVWG
jgi:hypothetical protein